MSEPLRTIYRQTIGMPNGPLYAYETGGVPGMKCKCCGCRRGAHAAECIVEQFEVALERELGKTRIQQSDGSVLVFAIEPANPPERAPGA